MGLACWCVGPGPLGVLVADGVGAVGVRLLSLVFRVLVCGGRGGYGAWWHGVVGLLRFRRLLVGLWARGRGCQ